MHLDWCDNFYIDKCLPFGLRSAPFLFNMVADALHWILQHYFANLFHYLDDFSLLAQLTHGMSPNSCRHADLLSGSPGSP